MKKGKNVQNKAQNPSQNLTHNRVFNSYNGLNSYGLFEATREYSLILDSAIKSIKKNNNNELVSKEIEKIKALSPENNYSTNLSFVPPFQIYADLFGNDSGVSSAVTFIKNTVCGIKWKIKDKFGFENTELTKDIQKIFNLRQIIAKAVQHYLVYGITIYLKKQKRVDDKLVGYPNFLLVPASEVSLFYANREKFEIDRISWNHREISIYNTIEKFDKFGDQNFNIGVDPDIDSQFFGISRLRGLVQLLDTKLRDDENYRLFLKNASFPGVIIHTPIDNFENPNLNNEIESAFRRLKEPEGRFSPSVIKSISGSTELVKFDIIKQSLENRLTLAEKEEIKGSIFDSFGLDRKLMGMVSSGLGGNEYTTALEAFKFKCVNPILVLLQTDLECFIIPEIFKSLESNFYFQRHNISINDNGKLRLATKEDFYFYFDEFVTETAESRALTGERLFKAGSIDSKTLLTKYAGMSELDVPVDSDFRIIPNSVLIYKTGDLVDYQGNKISQEKIESVENTTQKVDKSIGEGNEVVNNIEEKVKALASHWNDRKTRQKVNKFFEKAVKEDQNYSQIPNLLLTNQAKKVEDLIKDIIDKQYFSLKIDKVLENNIKTKAVDLNIPLSELESDIAQNIQSVKENLDTEALIITLLFFAKVGSQNVINQAKKEKGLELTPEQRVDIQKKVLNFIQERVNNLMGITPVEIPVFEYSFLNPYYEGSLDQTTVKRLAEIISQIIENNPDLSKTELESLILQTIKKDIEDRTKLITENNISLIFNLGIGLTALAFGKDRFEWLRTKSTEPRPVHLALVGQKRKADDFPEPPGALPNCKCSWRPVF